MDTQQVLPLSPAIFEAWLAKYEYTSPRQEGNRYFLSFSYDDQTDCQLEYSIIVGEGEHAMLSARGFSDKRFKSADRSEILELINEFHDNHRWPLLRLRHQGRRLNIDTSLDVDLSSGVHFELFDDILGRFMWSTYEFWKFVLAKGL
jgi:hypothetical protein